MSRPPLVPVEVAIEAALELGRATRDGGRRERRAGQRQGRGRRGGRRYGGQSEGDEGGVARAHDIPQRAARRRRDGDVVVDSRQPRPVRRVRDVRKARGFPRDTRLIRRRRRDGPADGDVGPRGADAVEPLAIGHDEAVGRFERQTVRRERAMRPTDGVFLRRDEPDVLFEDLARVEVAEPLRFQREEPERRARDRLFGEVRAEQESREAAAARDAMQSRAEDHLGLRRGRGARRSVADDARRLEPRLGPARLVGALVPPDKAVRGGLVDFHVVGLGELSAAAAFGAVVRDGDVRRVGKVLDEPRVVVRQVYRVVVDLEVLAAGVEVVDRRRRVPRGEAVGHEPDPRDAFAHEGWIRAGARRPGDGSALGELRDLRALARRAVELPPVIEAPQRPVGLDGTLAQRGEPVRAAILDAPDAVARVAPQHELLVKDRERHRLGRRRHVDDEPRGVPLGAPVVRERLSRQRRVDRRGRRGAGPAWSRPDAPAQQRERAPVHHEEHARRRAPEESHHRAGDGVLRVAVARF
mmetsp:Transcript_10274/g.41576  ORF Transcript_10274/g.41576 Transcript_10274/m.41576 type:complete len:526 (-) Transcript_10274:2-1579(-)